MTDTAVLSPPTTVGAPAPATLVAAAQRAGAVTASLRDGERLPTDLVGAGFAVHTGFVVGRLRLPASRSTELLGPGDVVFACDSEDLPADAALSWTALGDTELACFSEVAAAALLRRPGASRALLAAQARRVEHVRAMQAISILPRVDARVLAGLWLIADRFGRVAARGTTVGVVLPHRLIAELIGSQRPTVTTAVTRLAGQGLVSRDERGDWLLHGPPPERVVDLGRTTARGAPTRAAR